VQGRKNRAFSRDFPRYPQGARITVIRTEGVIGGRVNYDRAGPVVIILLVSKRAVMGAFTASRSLVILGWIATLSWERRRCECLSPVRRPDVGDTRTRAARTLSLGAVGPNSRCRKGDKPF
jgi:hypothetical protein